MQEICFQVYIRGHGHLDGPQCLSRSLLSEVNKLGEQKCILKKEATVVLSPIAGVTFHHFFCVLLDGRETPGPGVHKGVKTKRRGLLEVTKLSVDISLLFFLSRIN